MTADKSKQGRNNKKRGKTYELRVLKRLGAVRFPADTGGPIDGKIDGMAIQVKSGKTVATVKMREALASARVGCDTGDIPTVILVDRSCRPLQEWICFPLPEWADFNGYTEKVEASNK